jgi:dihydroxy-acid dehydratase
MANSNLFDGINGAYPRALYRAMGFSEADFNKPLIGIANSWSETNPGHYHLRKLAQWVKAGVRQAGGLPVEFNTVAPCDGIAQGEGMHYVLPLREIVAASVELMAGANRFDGLVMLCSCERSSRHAHGCCEFGLACDLVTGGPMAVGRKGEKDIILSDVKEGMGQYKAGDISAAEFYEIEACACPGPGACSFMGTANTMACVVETLGLSLPGCATMPAEHPDRKELCRESGRRIVALVRQGMGARHMLRAESFENAIGVVLALGGSTNAVLHLPAIARQAGVSIDLSDFDRLSRQTPLIGKFRPASHLTVIDLHAAGGIPAVLKNLLPLLHVQLPTVSDETILERAVRAEIRRENVIFPIEKPLAPEGGIAVLAVAWRLTGRS